MQVIRQHDDGVDAVGPAALNVANYLAECIDLFGEQPAATFKQGHGEEERPAWLEGPHVSRHGLICRRAFARSRSSGYAALSRPTGYGIFKKGRTLKAMEKMDKTFFC